MTGHTGEEKAVHDLADVNVLRWLRDIYRNIDRCLDMRDPGGFSRASHELRNLLSRLRDLIDNTSVADIASIGRPRAAGAGQPLN